MADGTSAQIKAMASGRTVTATVPHLDDAVVQAIPAVEGIDIRGDRVIITSRDTDAVARYLLTSTDARDLEIAAQGLEDAFIALTSEDTQGDHA